MNVLISIFVVLHGLVHMLYFGQSARLFELQSGFVWPDGSWLFSKLLGDEASRVLASIACVLVAIGFVGGGIGMLAHQEWWRPVVVSAALLSSAFYILFWDGKVKMLDVKGGIGLLINLVILLEVLAAGWFTATI